MGKYTYEDLKENLKNRKLKLLTKENEYKDLKHKVIISNGKYKGYIRPEHFMYKNKVINPYWFNRKNPFILENISS